MIRPPRSRAAIAVDLFTGAVIVSVAVALAGLSWRLVDGHAGGRHAVAIAPATPPAPIDLTAITALAPFGADAPVAATAAGNLILRAVMFARPASASTALVLAGDAPAQLLHVGDPAPGGAILDSIAIDHIVLRTGTGLQTLAFPKPGTPPAAGASGAPAPQPFVGLPTPAAPVASPSAPLYLPPPPGPAAAPAFLDSMGATATDGGYRIGPGASPAIRQAGLQPGDLVERINGTMVGNVDRDRALFAAAASGAPLRVEIVRGGRRITVSLPGR